MSSLPVFCCKAFVQRTWSRRIYPKCWWTSNPLLTMSWGAITSICVMDRKPSERLLLNNIPMPEISFGQPAGYTKADNEPLAPFSRSSYVKPRETGIQFLTPASALFISTRAADNQKSVATIDFSWAILTSQALRLKPINSSCWHCANVFPPIRTDTNY